MKKKRKTRSKQYIKKETKQHKSKKTKQRKSKKTHRSIKAGNSDIINEHLDYFENYYKDFFKMKVISEFNIGEFYRLVYDVTPPLVSETHYKMLKDDSINIIRLTQQGIEQCLFGFREIGIINSNMEDGIYKTKPEIEVIFKKHQTKIKSISKQLVHPTNKIEKIIANYPSNIFNNLDYDDIAIPEVQISLDL